MATLGTDAVRHGEALEAEFADGVERYLEAFDDVVLDASRADDTRRHTAIFVISALIGASTLSRTCAGINEELSEEILSVVRDRLLQDRNADCK